MDGKTLARIAAVVFIAIAVTTAVVEINRKDDNPVGVAPPTLLPITPNPSREGLRRCQALGEAALSDRECLALWAEQRDRFLGLKPAQPATPQPAAGMSRAPEAQ